MKFVDLEFENSLSYEDSLKRRQDISVSGKYVMGDNVDELEKDFAIDQNAKNCILVKNATDALAMTFIYLQANKRTVIVPQFGAYPTVVAALQAGAKKIIACSVDNSLTMDITSIDIPKDSIIVPVNLYGNSCKIKQIRSAADSAGGCSIVEDCAQSTGLSNLGLSDFMIHSFYPTKPMGCMGDGGAIITDSQDADSLLRKSRFYGLNKDGLIDTWGINSRIDEWQAAHLLSKIKYYRHMNQVRKINAKNFSVKGGLDYSEDCVYHQYVELYANRDKVREFFTKQGIPTMIHYPKMLSDMPFLSEKIKFTNCKRVSDHVLSLPVGPHLTREELDLIKLSICKMSNERLNYEEIM